MSPNATPQAIENSTASEEQMIILNRLIHAFEAYVSFQKDYPYAGMVFPAYGEYCSRGEKYLLSKSAQLWAVQVFEYFFFSLSDVLTDEHLAYLVQIITTEGLKKVQPNPEHMTSYLSLIIIARTVEPAAAARVKKTHFRKNFKFQLEGWADLRLAVIDLEHKALYLNRMAKPLKDTLTNNMHIVKNHERSKTGE